MELLAEAMESGLFNALCAAVKKEVRRHIKVFGDPDDETIAQVRCPPLEIPAEGAV